MKLNNLKIMKKDIYIKLIEFGRKNYSGFNYEDLNKSQELDDDIKEVGNIMLKNAYSNTFKSIHGGYSNLETMFLVKSNNGGYIENYIDPKIKYVLNLDADFKYIDYQELKHARRMSREAKKTSEKSIKIAIIAMMLSVIIPIIVALLFTQTIKVNRNQFNEIKTLINNK